MKEAIGNIFNQEDACAICFTSNGKLKLNGELVMGAGIAKAFKDRWPWLPALFGLFVKESGNQVHNERFPLNKNGVKFSIVSFPTKYHWRDPSDLELIFLSAMELKCLADEKGWQKIYLPRPGCSLGGLDWESQVKPLIAPILDDRFIILTLK